MSNQNEDNVDWKNKFNDLLNTCQTELKKTTQIGMKMLSASQSNAKLHETYEALGLWLKEAIENGAQLHTDYEARNENEIAVLVEWITGVETPTAEYIHLILYSKEQMAKEDDPVEADWAIVSIGGAATVEVEPMRPITAMRNALGVEEGGSGVAIDRQAYSNSVDFWSKFIMIRE